MNMIRKLGPTIIALAMFAAVTALVAGQEEETETFVRELVRSMERMGWQEDELTEIEQHLYTYRWEEMTGVNPETVAIALRYGQDKGSIGSSTELAAAALELAYVAREMKNLGLNDREITRTSLSGMRRLGNERERFDTSGISSLREQIRGQMRSQIKRNQEVSLKSELQTRLNNPKDPELWAPAKPVPPPAGNDQNMPRGPGGDSEGGPGAGGTP